MLNKLYLYILIVIGILGGYSAVFADHFYGHHQDSYEQGDRGYSNGPYEARGYSSGEERSHSRQYAAVDYGSASDSYYACPNGDYISDRPGQCPLDGMSLVPRRSSSGHQRSPYTDPYSY